MHELTRRAYLEAMGLPGYVSRSQLPGAAPTRRLIPRRRVATPPPEAPTTVAPTGSALTDDIGALVKTPARSRAPTPASGPETSRPRRPATVGSPVVQFSLLSLQMADWLWLEALPEGAASRDYVALAQSIGRALGDAQCAHAQFDWPLHSSPQLDRGAQAASAALDGFLQRRLDLQPALGVVLLGELPLEGYTPPLERQVKTVGLGDMLRDASLKRRAWQDLQGLQGS